MGKKTDKKLLKYAVREVEEKENEVQEATTKFYPDDSLANFSYSSSEDILETLVAKSKTSDTSPQQVITEEQLEKSACCTHENVKKCQPNNIEIRLDQMAQFWSGSKYLLENTIIRIRGWDGDTSPSYIYIKDGDTLDLRVFIDGDNAMAVMAIRDEDGKVHFIRLAEFHLFSIQSNPDPQKEIGLLTSYVWLTAKVYTSVIMASSFLPIKSLLLSEWLQAEWQKAKAASGQPTNEETRGESNE